VESARPGLDPAGYGHVTVVYNGADVDLVYRPDDAISRIQSHAMALLGIACTVPPALALFTEDGAELNGMLRVEKLISPGDTLTLRPRVIR